MLTLTLDRSCLRRTPSRGKGENDVLFPPILSCGRGCVCVCVLVWGAEGMLRKAMSSKEEISTSKEQSKTGINAVKNTNHCEII